VLPKRENIVECYDVENVRPINERPEHRIEGGAAIRRFEVLNDKRHILAKDSDDNIALYDVLKVPMIYLYDTALFKVVGRHAKDVNEQ